MDIKNPLGGPVHYKEETKSTMEDARRLLVDKQAVPGHICMAGFQSQGRGRIPGRVWQAPLGESLMFTLILSKEKLNLRPSLSLRAGLAVSRYLEQVHGLEPRIKWPNDVFCKEKKLCGILCEFRSDHVLMGMGLNLNQSGFPQELPRAGSLRMLTGASYDPWNVLEDLLPFIEASLTPEIPLEQWNSRLLWKDQAVELKEGHPRKDNVLQGYLRGIASDGALLLEEKGKHGQRKAIYSGELVIS